MKRCRKQPERKHISTTIDLALYDRLKPIIEEDWGGTLSSWLDYAATCYLRETCDECPYSEEKGQKKVGIGKVETLATREKSKTSSIGKTKA
jgi:predicted nucleic-acid-binding Zn-ribbon protein